MENNTLKMTYDVIKNAFKRKTPVGIAIFGALALIIILGYMVTMAGTTDTVTLGVVNHDAGIGNISAASNIIEEIKNQDNITVISIDESDVNADFKDKKVDAVLIFPENFTADLAMKKNADVSLQTEGTDQMKTATVNRGILSSAMELATKNNESIPVNINSANHYADGFDFANLFIYRIMALVTMILSGVVALFSVLGDKADGTFNQKLKSPVKAVVSYITGLSLIAFLIPLTVLAYSIYILNIQIAGGITNAVLLLLLIAVSGVSLGVLASALPKKDKQSGGIFGLLIFLQVLFAGLLVPVARFDYYVQWVSSILPLTYGLDAMKSVVLRGFSLGDVGMDLVAISTIILASSIITIVGLKIKSNKRCKSGKCDI